MMVAANGHEVSEKISMPWHLSQSKPSQNPQAIHRFVPGARIFLEPKSAWDEQLFTRSVTYPKVHRILRLNPSHFCLFASTVGRVGVGIESGRDKVQEEDVASRPENEVTGTECGEEPSVRVPVPAGMSGARALAILLLSCCC